MTNSTRNSTKITYTAPDSAEIDWAEQAESDTVDPEPDQTTSETHKPWNPDLIRVDVKPFSVKQVLDMIQNGDLDLQPEYQRRRVWSEQQKSLLIESILLRIPLPAFYFASDNQGSLQVIDGMQRLSAIQEFVHGQGSTGTPQKQHLKLKSLEYLNEQLGGKQFSDLKDQLWGRRLLQTTLIVNVVDPQTPEAVKFNIFSRLNKQGTPLSPQELRFAMSGKRSRATLQNLSRLPIFHEATDHTLHNNIRMHDLDAILRFCLFQLQGPPPPPDTTTMSPLPKLAERLHQVARDLNDQTKVPDDRVASLELAFTKAMSNSTTAFSRFGFRKNKLLTDGSVDKKMPFNKGLFEVWSYILSDINMTPEQVGCCRSAHNALLDNPSFMEQISFNTGDPSRVSSRFAIALRTAKEHGVNVR